MEFCSKLMVIIACVDLVTPIMLVTSKLGNQHRVSHFFYNKSIISWCSSRQQSVSLSTTESEYIAASDAVKELIWLKRLFGELLPEQSESAISFFMDNMSAIRLVKNPEFHKRTKHIDVRYHFIRTKYEEGMFDLEHVSSKEMIADIFTKALPRERFEFLRASMGITSKENL